MTGATTPSRTVVRAGPRGQPTNILALNNYAYYLAVRGVQPERSVELAAQVVALSPGNGNFEHPMRGRSTERETMRRP